MVRNSLTFVLILLCVIMSPTTASATGGDRYLTLQGDYRAIGEGETITLHTPALTLGGGYNISDFWLIEGTLSYGATYGNGSFQNLAGAAIAGRFLVDATQWIPSLGAQVGYMAGYNGRDGLRHALYAGGSACLDYRIWRTHSLAICGEYNVVPLQDAFRSFWGVGFRVNGFVPYMFE